MADPGSERKKPRRSWRRRARTALLVTLFVYGMVELLSWGAYAIVFDDGFSFDGMQKLRGRILQAPEDAAAAELARLHPTAQAQAIHPYHGYAMDKTLYRDGVVNDLGFHGVPIGFGRATRKGDRDHVAVVVVGGSVAYGLADSAHLGPALERGLRNHPRYGGKPVKIHNCAIPAMKQPQQLMVVNWFLTLDGDFDVVLNLDGFNEVVLTAINNVARKFFPFYPRMWDLRVRMFSDPKLALLAGKAATVRESRIGLARFFAGAVPRRSVTANVVWRLLDRRKERELVDAQRAAQWHRGDEHRGYAATGPERRYDTPEKMYDDLATHWARSSRMLQSVTRAHGIDYVHCLQPNQYTPDAKVFGEEEKKVAFEKRPKYRPHVVAGYPVLRESGKGLLASGVPYSDLTDVFHGLDESLFIDDCCHVNDRGNALLAARIGEEVGRWLGR